MKYFDDKGHLLYSSRSPSEINWDRTYRIVESLGAEELAQYIIEETDNENFFDWVAASQNFGWEKRDD